ncbi:MAG: protein-L-isoaspartate(D-aspartate) O-methyltransferase [Betaproteobacteria bacterium]|nr:protein-L-isoaspartate(D-aspartate) O-methyltransferase [Betaproteobacteria bacterium]
MAALSRGLARMLGETSISDEEILDAFAQVPRQEFLDDSLKSRWLDNMAFPIGHAQTTSQPEVMARMLELVWNRKHSRQALEVGAGCGYMAALLARLYKQVVAVERIRALAVAADHRLKTLGYNNVRIVHGDGKLGIPDGSGFDAIIVSAAATQAPEPLLAQLSGRGRLVIPEKSGAGAEHLVLYRKNAGKITRSEHDRVSFVPLLSGKESR